MRYGSSFIAETVRILQPYATEFEQEHLKQRLSYKFNKEADYSQDVGEAQAAQKTLLLSGVSE